MRFRGFAVMSVVAGLAAAGQAAVKTEAVDYTHDGVTYKGLLAYDDAAQGKQPGVLVVHEWYGLDDYAKGRAKQLAALGYVAFAADMYGEGRTAKHPKEAGEMAGAVRKNVASWVGRAKAALKVLQDNPRVDPDKLAAIGYCFGGSTVQQLAYSGAPVKVVGSFHGAPVVPSAEQAKAVKGAVFVAHGADDGFIKPETLDAMLKALKDANAAVVFEAYPGAKHSFTVPEADKAGVPGLAYQKEADEKSWATLQKLLAEKLGK